MFRVNLRGVRHGVDSCFGSIEVISQRFGQNHLFLTASLTDLAVLINVCVKRLLQWNGRIFALHGVHENVRIFE